MDELTWISLNCVGLERLNTKSLLKISQCPENESRPYYRVRLVVGLLMDGFSCFRCTSCLLLVKLAGEYQFHHCCDVAATFTIRNLNRQHDQIYSVMLGFAFFH